MPRKASYSPEDLARALIDVRSAKLSIRAAAQKYKVPKTIVHRFVNVNFALAWPPTVLSKQEEDDIVKWLFDFSKRGFPIAKTQLLSCVQLMLNEQSRVTKFNDNRPGRTWLKGFLHRNKSISVRLAQNINRARASVTEDFIRSWFKEVEEYMDEENCKDVLSDPRRIFNFDETAIHLNPPKKFFLSTRGAKNVYNISDNEKECLTVLLGCNAKGECPPAMILYRYERVPSHISTSVPKSITMGASKSGWMSSEIFYRYMTETFLPWTQLQNIPFPILVFLDGHASHLTLPLCEFCNENKIILVALPPNSTHILQPLDVGVIFPLKTIWKRKRQQWDYEHKDVKFNRTFFATLMDETLKELQINETVFANAFRTCGLHPFDVEAVNYTKILAVRATTPVSQNTIVSANHGYLEHLINNLDADLLAKFAQCAETGLDWTEDSSNENLYRIWKSSISQVTDDEERRPSHNDIESADDDDDDEMKSFTTERVLDDALDLQTEHNPRSNMVLEPIELEFIDRFDPNQILILPESDVSEFISIQSTDTAYIEPAPEQTETSTSTDTAYIERSPEQPKISKSTDTTRNVEQTQISKCTSDPLPTPSDPSKTTSNDRNDTMSIVHKKQAYVQAAIKGPNCSKNCYDVLQALNKPKEIVAARKVIRVKKPSVISSSMAIQKRQNILLEKKRLQEEKLARKEERERVRAMKKPATKRKRSDSFVASATPSSSDHAQSSTTEGFTPPKPPKPFMQHSKFKRALLFSDTDSN